MAAKKASPVKAASDNSDAAVFAGQVRVFKYMSGSWTQMAGDIQGENAQDEFGTAVALNADGTVLVAGAPYCDAGGNNIGTVRVFNNPDVGLTENTSGFDLIIYPNPAQDILSLDLSSLPSDMYTVSVVSLEGKYILTLEMPNSIRNIDLSVLGNGVYLLQVKSEDLLQQVKFIKK